MNTHGTGVCISLDKYFLKYYFSDIFHVLNFYLYVVIKNQLKNYLPRFLCLKVCLPLKEVRHMQIDMSRFTSLF